MIFFKTKKGKIKKILKKYNEFINSKAYKDVMAIKREWENIFDRESKKCPLRNIKICNFDKHSRVCMIQSCPLVKKKT